VARPHPARARTGREHRHLGGRGGWLDRVRRRGVGVRTAAVGTRGAQLRGPLQPVPDAGRARVRPVGLFRRGRPAAAPRGLATARCRHGAGRVPAPGELRARRHLRCRSGPARRAVGRMGLGVALAARVLAGPHVAAPPLSDRSAALAAVAPRCGRGRRRVAGQHGRMGAVAAVRQRRDRSVPGWSQGTRPDVAAHVGHADGHRAPRGHGDDRGVARRARAAVPPGPHRRT